MEEYLHYDDTANGALNLVDPSRLLLFDSDAAVPAIADMSTPGHKYSEYWFASWFGYP